MGKLLRGRRQIMATLKILDVKTFADVRHVLPIRKEGGILYADSEELVRAYLDLARAETEAGGK